MRKILLLPVFVVAAFLTTAGAAHAATATYQYAGTTTSTMSVNDGTHVGSIPSGTPYTGTLAFDDGPTAPPAPFGGGTHTVYGYSQMTFTALGQTLTWGPGSIHVYDNLTSTTSGYPTGDSVYANINGVGPSGTINGAFFNWIFLGLVDPSGTAVSGGAIPSTLALGSFQSRFVEFNYGTKGTPWGAGNTSTLQFLSSLTKTSGGVVNPPLAFAPSLPDGIVGTPYAASFAAATGGTAPYAYSATGLPAGLTLSGTTVSGTPTTAGSYSVGLTATDAAGASVNATVGITVLPPLEVSTTSLPSGTVGLPYTAQVAARRGVAPYTLGVTGLPAGLSFDGGSIVGTPSAAGTSTVTVTARDAAGATASAALSLTIAPAPPPAGNYTVKDESRGKITAFAPDYSYLMVGTKKLVWGPATLIVVNTPDGERHVIDSFVKVGMRVQWKGLRDKATNTVLTSQLEVN